MPSILCVMPHPDDESFGPAGTIAKYVAQGIAVDLLVLTKGQVGARPQPFDSADQLGLARSYETRAAARVLGVRNVQLLDYMDGDLDKVDLDELASHVAGAIERTAPDAIITYGPYGITKHVDHVACHRATLAAVQRSPREPRLFYIALEPPWTERFELDGPETQPTHRIEMADYFQTKLTALACHFSQQDAREFFLGMSQGEQTEELFHQAIPPYRADGPASDLFA